MIDPIIMTMDISGSFFEESFEPLLFLFSFICFILYIFYIQYYKIKDMILLTIELNNIKIITAGAMKNVQVSNT